MKKYTFLVILLLLVFSCKKKAVNTKLSGLVFGTSYGIQYYSKTQQNFQQQFDSLFYTINKSLSTYQFNSDISKINRNEELTIDSHFRKVFNASKEIYKLTEGAFDPTIGILVNAWDFGPEGKIVDLDSIKIDSLMQFVGFDKVRLLKNKIIKQAPIFLDFNAIAKGYSVDVIAEFLEQQNIAHYIIDIGGEIRAKGINRLSMKPWNVGIESPNFDSTQSISKTISLSDEAMATSGTYRKFKVDAQGNKYAHIIDTKTGYPSKTKLLSISVIAKNCMTADAYATAFKVMGIDRIKFFLKTHPELKAFLIFENKDNKLETLTLNGFPKKQS